MKYIIIIAIIALAGCDDNCPAPTVIPKKNGDNHHKVPDSSGVWMFLPAIATLAIVHHANRKRTKQDVH
jgi:hypothetical protein